MSYILPEYRDRGRPPAAIGMQRHITTLFSQALVRDLFILICLSAALRLVFQALVPPFINKDSVSYFLPGWDLANGEGFIPDYRRAPLYSWFIAAALKVFGNTLNAVSLAQHILGIASVIVTYALGRAAFNRPIALVGGVLAAVSGPLLIFEHRIDAETTFSFLLLLSALLLTLGCKRSSLRWLIAGGLALGLASITRPAGQVIALALPLTLLLLRHPLRLSISWTLAMASGFLLVKLPWTLLLLVSHGEVLGGATVGEPLVSHLVYGERWMRDAYLNPLASSLPRPAREVSDALLSLELSFPLPGRDWVESEGVGGANARAFAIRQLGSGASPSRVRELLETRYSLSPLACDALLRDLASSMIREHPLRFVLSTLRGSAMVMLGRFEHVDISWNLARSQSGQPVEDNWFEVRRIRQLVRATTPEQSSSYPLVASVSSAVQPSQFGLLMGLLYLASLIPCLRRQDWHYGTLIWFSVLTLILASSALSWPAPRYRYPVDPMIYLLCAACVTSLGGSLFGSPRKLLWKR